MRHIDLSGHGITVADVRRNLPPAELYAEAIRGEPDCASAETKRPVGESIQLSDYSMRESLNRLLLVLLLERNEPWCFEYYLCPRRKSLKVFIKNG